MIVCLIRTDGTLMTDSFPPFPDRIKDLGDLASDLWWSWHKRSRDLFRRLDFALWRLTDHNPVRMLQLIPRERLEEAAADRTFLAPYDDMVRALKSARLARESWWVKTFGENGHGPIAYFSAEFALHQSLPIQRPGTAVRRGRVHVSAGILPPERLR
jgi:starch phosphorylase